MSNTNLKCLGVKLDWRHLLIRFMFRIIVMKKFQLRRIDLLNVFALDSENSSVDIVFVLVRQYQMMILL